MKASIKVRTIHWVIVEQTEEPEKSFAIEEQDCFYLDGMGNQKQGFKVTRIGPTSVDILLTGPSLVSATEGTSLGQSPYCMTLSLNVGESKKVATPTLDAGMVWTISLVSVE